MRWVVRHGGLMLGLTGHQRRAAELAIRVKPVVGRYFTGGIPRSLQIFLAKKSSISVCLGTAERLLSVGLRHHECRDPSRTNSQPWERRYVRSSLLFIERSFLLENRSRPTPKHPAG